MVTDAERVEISLNLHEALGHLAHHLDLFGDTLAEREGYEESSGMDAVHFYLVHKFGWLPGQVRAMSFEDMRFVLQEEMRGWRAPGAARALAKKRAAKKK